MIIILLKNNSQRFENKSSIILLQTPYQIKNQTQHRIIGYPSSSRYSTNILSPGSEIRVPSCVPFTNLPLCPISSTFQLSEQQTIACYLDAQSEKIDRIVANINRQLGKLTKLKKSLINECVTGERIIQI